MNARIYSLILFIISGIPMAYGQGNVGIGVTTPNKNAVLELVSSGNNQGLLVPKMSTAQRTASAFTANLTTLENGLLVYDTNDNNFYCWSTDQWKVIGSAVPQDLSLVGSTLKITNNPSATPIDLSPFAGTNTDGQTLTYTPATGVLSISTLTTPQSVTITTAGAASGDLGGTYPAPTLNDNTVTSAKIVDGTITAADLSNLSIDNTKLATGISVAKLTPGSNGQVLTTTAGAVAWGTIPAGTLTSIATGTGLTGGPITTSGTISLANTAVAPGTYGSATTVPQIIVDQQGRITSATATTVTGVAPGGTAGGDLTGTYPSPTILANAVTSAKIADGSIVNADINAAAAIDVTKFSAGASGQVLTTSGGIPQWANPSGTVLINNAGTRNLFAGSPVGTSTGTDNAFFGSSAGNANTSGNYNVIAGSGAGQFKTVGDLNTLVGWLAGQATGSTATYNGNTFLGAQAGQNATGGPNTYVGEKSGQATTTGTQNLFAGNRAGITNTVGAQNTILGYFADLSANNLQNATAIGYTAVVNANNKIRLGNTAITVIEGQVPFTSASDRRFKTAIAPLAAGLDFILKLNPVTYRMKNSAESKTNWGFIAQEIETLVGEGNALISIGADKDKTLGLRYTDFVAPLVKAVQEQQTEIEALRVSLKQKETQIKALEESLNTLKSGSAEIAAIKDQLDKIKKSLGL